MTSPSRDAGTRPLYEALAEAFAAEGITRQFVLMGDGNMHWSTTLAGLGAEAILARHEHCAVSMAMAYANATGEVGVASVTCGPGLTQIMTALATAERARLPIVVFAGESPAGSLWYNQEIDQAPFVAATGAHYLAMREPALAVARVREAFLYARRERRPVVVAMPLDLQQRPDPGKAAYRPSTELLPDVGRMHPDPAHLEAAAAAIDAAKRIVVIGGRGAKRSGAADACRRLAEATGALLATTLPVRGLFHDDPFDLGIAGGFASDVAREAFARADLVVAVGAGLTHHTSDGGKLYGQARVLQIDEAPVGVNQGREVADLYLRADARVGVEALLARLPERREPVSDWRGETMRRAIAEEPADGYAFDGPLGGLDPREAIRALDAAIPKDWDLVNGSGHSSYFAAHMRGRPATRFHTIREFGAIGNGLSYAIGVAAARPGRPVVLFDGDGGFLMHAQELETIRRHGLKILLCILNDGAYGSEIHKLRADGLSDAGSVFGRGDLGAVARGFGLNGTILDDLADLPAKVAAFDAGDRAALWDIHISDRVMSPVMRRAHPPKGH